jgi:hypothetical protein
MITTREVNRTFTWNSVIQFYFRKVWLLGRLKEVHNKVPESIKKLENFKHFRKIKILTIKPFLLFI